MRDQHRAAGERQRSQGQVRGTDGPRRTGPDPALVAHYLHEEYGGIDSDMFAVNLWAEPKGHAWSYQAAYDLVYSARARTGIAFDPHWCRHRQRPGGCGTAFASRSSPRFSDIPR